LPGNKRRMEKLLKLDLMIITGEEVFIIFFRLMGRIEKIKKCANTNI
jgi:hypothetical protein